MIKAVLDDTTGVFWQRMQLAGRVFLANLYGGGDGRRIVLARGAELA